MVDKAFSLLIAWSGRMAINSYRIFAMSTGNTYQGECNPDETGPRLLTEEGCGENELFSELEAFDTYASTKTYSKDHPDMGLTMTHTATSTSRISQIDADRKAQKAAEVYVQTLIGEM